MEAPLSEKLINKYFNMAKNVSMLSDYYDQHHLGCVIIYKNRVIADGYNTLRTSPIQKEYNKYRPYDKDTKNNGSLHAEIMALSRCKEVDIDWSKASIFIYREHKDGIKALAAPCQACRRAIIDKGIHKIYYTGINSYIYERID